MIKKIRIRFVAVAMAALFVLLAVIVTGMNIINYNAVVQDADGKLEVLSSNQGRFPDFGRTKRRYHPFHMTEETPYEIRYFSVLRTPDGQLIHVDTSRIKAIDDNTAVQYAAEVHNTQEGNGFLGSYRFTMLEDEEKTRITFLDCSRELYAFRNFLLSSIFMALGGYLGFFFVILFFSSRITKPVAESYEKQKRFITDASHEIKTPLAIIQADVDVLEMEYGENEWLLGIQDQVKRLSDLTNDLVYLSRMEESQSDLQMIDFPFSDVVSETVHTFYAIAQTQEKHLQCSIQPMLSLTGNEKSIRQLVNLLMDNALKYSPPGGDISLTVSGQGSTILLSVFNTTAEPIEKKQLPHLFERFYRMDSSRSSQTGGYGIGLSVAKAIVTAHGGKITAATQDGLSLQINVQFPV